MSALLLRDLRLALRSGGGFGLGLAFFLIVIVLVPFGIGPERALLARIAPGMLWVAALLAALLTLDRLFALDHEDGALQLLATAPLPLESLILAKALAHWLTTGLPLTLAAPLLGPLLALPAGAAPWLLLSLALGTPALSLIGAFGAALTLSIRRGGLLLSLIVLPLYVPTLIFGAEMARRGAEGLAQGAAPAMLAALSLGCLALMPFAAAAALRVNLR
ncbi:heme exporter protein CcmB [Pseudoroseicyclus sp. CXY001]|uniref:heme exporter protein CcmB n=1 Tax=Pseudoroseicyclus sp. CXY001 TaxID=3242492 RepID=UPI00358DB2D4